MDLPLYLRVLWRFRVLVAAGLLLATTLAFFSYVKVELDGGKPSFVYRQGEQWESLATVGVASRTFDPGSVLTPETRGFLNAPGGSAPDARERLSQIDPAEFASLPRLNEITVQLMRLATSDEVTRIMLQNSGPIDGLLQTFPVTAGDSLVPYITFSAIADTPEKALSFARRHVAAFTQFVTARQEAARIPAEERVVIQVVNEAQPATLLEGRKKTQPIIVFLTVMTAVLGLCFVLENMRPRMRPVAPSEEDEQVGTQKRRRTA